VGWRRRCQRSQQFGSGGSGALAAVAGHSQIERVDISERSGDSSRIKFTALRVEPNALSAAELADFE